MLLFILLFPLKNILCVRTWIFVWKCAMCMSDAPCGQKMVLDALELEL